MTRSEAREQAFIFIFEKIFNPELSIEEMKEFAQESELFTLDKFAEKIVACVNDNIDAIDETIKSCLKGWTISRIPRVALALLRLAVCEIIYFENVPDKVSANEAVELAKKYAGEKDVPFINGVLGSVIRGKNS